MGQWHGAVDTIEIVQRTLDIECNAFEQHASPIFVGSAQLPRRDFDVAHDQQFTIQRKGEQALVLVENQCGQGAPAFFEQGREVALGEFWQVDRC